MRQKYVASDWIFPFAAMLGCGLFCAIYQFNGLYGQDAYEYNRLVGVFADRMAGRAVEQPTIGETEFAGLFPMMAALISLTGCSTVLSMQLVNALAFGVCAALFSALLRLVTPGASRQSRQSYLAVAFLAAPYIFRAGVSGMADISALAFTLAAFYHGIRELEHKRGTDAIGLAFFSVLAFGTRYSTAVLFLPLLILVGYEMVIRFRRWGIVWSVLAAFLAFLPQLWLKWPFIWGFLGHSSWAHYGVHNWFVRSFSDGNGLIRYWLPNLAYVIAYPLAHPGFFMPLLLLGPLTRKTDLGLWTKRVVLGCVVVHCLYLAGLSSQNARFLIPDFAILLLLFFPAWDRMWTYGFYFLKKRWMYPILACVAGIQLAGLAYVLKPLLARHDLEKKIAQAVEQATPQGTEIYTFDMDPAMGYYLPGRKWRNMWGRQYESFSSGSYFLICESLLQTQWAGRNPEINWAAAKEACAPVQRLAGGWVLYRVE